MPRIPRLLIFILIAVVLFALVWSRVRILIHIPLSPWTALILFGSAVVILFLVVEHFINRNRD